MTTLLVANDGGHVMQLHTLRPRLGLGSEVVWVTPRTPQTESLLAGERVHWVSPSPPRDMAAVARNAASVRSLFSSHDVSLVVSTGAALALSVLPQARLRGIEAVYIESATRTESPSLSGRLLAMVPGVRTYSQSATLTSRRWTYLASPWDNYRSLAQPSRAIRRVVVSLGTQEGYGFRRLVEALLPLLPSDAEVLWQTGSTDTHGLPIAPRAAVPAAEMAAAVGAADLVVAHAGTGIALLALENGRVPVLVPRRAHLAEHVDDHQLSIALELSLRDLCVARDADSLKVSDLELASSRRAVRATHVPGLQIVRPRRAPEDALTHVPGRPADTSVTSMKEVP